MVNLQKIKEFGINQSTLKTVNFLPSKIEEDTSLFYEEKECLILGNLVDTLLLEPYKFEERFYLDEVDDKPTDKVMSWIQEIIDLGATEYNEETILYFIDQLDYQNNWKQETKVKFLLSELCSSYFYNVLASKGKQVVSKKEAEIAFKVVETFTTSFNTKKYFCDFVEDKNTTVLNQYLLNTEMYGFKVYGTLDRIYINEKDKTILPIDIKTTGEYTINFQKSFHRFKYYYQAIIYTWLLEANYPGYTIFPFEFLVESVKSPGLPLIYKIDPDKEKDYVEEVKNSFELLKWHIENEVFSMPKYIYEKGGVLLC